MFLHFQSNPTENSEFDNKTKYYEEIKTKTCQLPIILYALNNKENIKNLMIKINMTQIP